MMMRSFRTALCAAVVATCLCAAPMVRAFEEGEMLLHDLLTPERIDYAYSVAKEAPTTAALGAACFMAFAAGPLAKPDKYVDRIVPSKKKRDLVDLARENKLQLFTHAIFHADQQHLVGNALGMVSMVNVEKQIGSFATLFYALVAAAAPNVVWRWSKHTNTNADIWKSLGASGVVYFFNYLGLALSMKRQAGSKLSAIKSLIGSEIATAIANFNQPINHTVHFMGMVLGLLFGFFPVQMRAVAVGLLGLAAAKGSVSKGVEKVKSILKQAGQRWVKTKPGKIEGESKTKPGKVEKRESPAVGATADDTAEKPSKPQLRGTGKSDQEGGNKSDDESGEDSESPACCWTWPRGG